MKFRDFLAEATTRQKVIVVYGGGFQPFHAGHMSSYEQAKRAFPTADFYVAASNDTKTRPIPFKDKQFLAQQAGVKDNFVQVSQPVNPVEILKHYNPKKDVLILVRSERDPVKYTKKDGSPAYYQPFKSLKECSPFDPEKGHGYVFVTKKHVFTVNGQEAYSGSQIRSMYSKADDKGKKNIIKDLYPKATKPEKVKQLLDKYIGGLNEDINIEFEELLIEGVHDKSIFKAVFLAGGPGSGKDYVLDNTLAGHGLTEINSDKALEFLMDKEGLDKTMPASEQDKRDLVRGRAKSMTELRQKLALLGRNGLIINGTGDDHEKIKRIKDRLEEIGYDTSMILVNTADEVSKQRNIERGMRGGRTVPEEIRKQKWDAVQASRPELAKMFGQNYKEFDNSEDLRTAPPEVVKSKKQEMLDLYKGIQQFVSEPPQSEAASMWVAHELDKKDTLPVPKGGAEMVPHPDSGAAEEARKMGLQYYGFGRYGRNGQVTHRSVHDKLIEVQKGEQKEPNIPVPGTSMKKKPVNEEFEEFFAEDLRRWFSKTDPEGGWKRINSKGEAIGPCAREPGEPKPKCMSNEKRAALSKKERAAAVRAKRKHDPNPERKGEPINVSNFGKGKLSESYQLSDSGALNILLLGTNVEEVDLYFNGENNTYDFAEERKKTVKLMRDTNGKVRTFMLRRAAAKEAHLKNGTVMPYKNGYVIKINEENEDVSSINQLTENQTERGKTITSFRRSNESGARESGRILTEGVTELTTGSEYAKGGIEATPTTTQETGGTKITLAKIRAKQKEITKESIDKGIEPGLSMATGGENATRSAPKNKLVKKPLEEMQGDETTASIGAKKEDELKKQGINLQSFRAKRPI